MGHVYGGKIPVNGTSRSCYIHGNVVMTCYGEYLKVTNVNDIDTTRTRLLLLKFLLLLNLSIH